MNNEQMKQISNEFIDLSPNAKVNTRLFTISVIQAHVTITIPINAVYRYCHGVGVRFGRSALNELTCEIFPDWSSPYRPGMPNMNDPMCRAITQKIQVPHNKCERVNVDQIPLLRRRYPKKIFIPNSENLQFTLDVILPD